MELASIETIPEDFHERYVAAQVPVIVRGAAGHWPAVGKWTPDHLKERIGHHRVSQASLDQQTVSEFLLADFLDLLSVPREEVAELPYLRNKFLHHDFEELSQDVGPLEFLGANWLEVEPLASLIRVMRPRWVDWCEFFISHAQTRFPFIHTDTCMLHAWSAQIFGHKRYWVWPPMPRFRDVECIGQDLTTFLDTEPAHGVLGPGDVAFIPSGWPHVAESVTVSITISGAYVNETNWSAFAQEFCEDHLGKELRSA